MQLFLNFSDSAKYAQAAVSLFSGDGFKVTHSFFTFKNLTQTVFPADFFPLTPTFLTVPLKIFGISDQTIILSGLFLLFLTLFCLFYSGYRLSGKWTGLISVITFLIIPDTLNYFWNFSSEAVAMTFLSLSVAFYLRNKPKNLYLLFTILSIFARPQLICLPLAYMLSKRKYFVSLMFILFITVFGFLYRQAFISLNFSPKIAQGQYLRGKVVEPLLLSQLASKIFYNIYNFIKAPDRIVSIGILSIALIRFTSFSLFTFYSTALLMLMASMTLPNARYVHPILPLIVLLFAHNLPKKIWSTLVIILLAIPILGQLTIDNRHKKIIKIPIYKEIADQIASYLPKNELIVTNLDAWAAWYYGLSTLWFPLKPEMLASHPPKYIVITNYLENDADFALGEWREVVYSPYQLQNEFLKNNYFIFKIISSDSFRGTILVRKS